jgi:glycerol-1-phosphate dehydrogenase [NAD(P)+]
VYLSLDKFTGPCACGKSHQLQTKAIVIERNAVEKLPELIQEMALPSGVCVICDENTFVFAQLAAKQIKPLLHGIKPYIVLNPNGLHADEHAVERVMAQLPADTAWLLAAGSGTIHDITRYVANQRAIPFISFPTAASVDGFDSTICAMTWHGFKKTLPGVAPLAVVADTDIFANAPYRLTASGVGDVLGKYISLVDWQIANYVSGEDFCPEIAAISYEAVDNVRENLSSIHRHGLDAMEKLMYALLLSGIAMQMWGTSRPASGSEHHFSHLWEMEVINPHLDALHGEKVGVGLNVALPLYKSIAGNPDFGRKFKSYTGIPKDLIKEKFGVLYDAIIEENTPDAIDLVETDKIAAHIDDIRALIARLPDEKTLRDDMARARILTELPQIGLSADILPDSINLAPFVRNRVTLMRLLKILDI